MGQGKVAESSGTGQKHQLGQPMRRKEPAKTQNTRAAKKPMRGNAMRTRGAQAAANQTGTTAKNNRNPKVRPAKTNSGEKPRRCKMKRSNCKPRNRPERKRMARQTTGNGNEIQTRTRTATKRGKRPGMWQQSETHRRTEQEPKTNRKTWSTSLQKTTHHKTPLFYE